MLKACSNSVPVITHACEVGVACMLYVQYFTLEGKYSQLPVIVIRKLICVTSRDIRIY